jgi:23S rRNA (adenine2503-C2)-methyltransferase
MGMGEPLLNYDNVLKSIALLTDEDTLNLSIHKITVSTVGLARRIRDLADAGTRFHLAVSLHAPDNETRSAIMPVNTSEKTSLPALKEALQYYHAETGRPVTYEYCLFHGVNDAVADAKRLAAVSRWIPSKVNLLLYNPVEGLPFERTPDDQLDRFIQALVQEGVTVTVRRSRGQDIDAACGQLANKE